MPREPVKIPADFACAKSAHGVGAHGVGGGEYVTRRNAFDDAVYHVTRLTI
jgi:hypothetical protein